jgi:hypothetical protein
MTRNAPGTVTRCAPAGTAAATMSGSSPTGSRAYISTAQPSGVMAPGPVP